MTIQGLKQLNRKLKAIPKAAKEAAVAAVIQGANEVAALQRSLAPVEDGDLKASIHVTLPGQTTPPYSIAQESAGEPAREGQAIVTAGNTKVRYAHIVEFGAAPHVIKPKDGKTPMGKDGRFGIHVDHPGTNAQPFFWPAWRALRGRVRSRTTRNINKAIKAAATSGGA